MATSTQEPTADGAPPLSPLPRRVRTPRWLDLRLVLGIALVLGSVLLGAVVISNAHHTRTAFVATRALAAGTQLGEADVEAVEVQLPDEQQKLFPDEQSSVVGQTLTRSLVAGELISTAALGGADQGTTVSVPLASGAAPDLHAGQRVRFWLSTKTCRAVVLIADSTVSQVHDSSGSFSSTRGQDIVLRLDGTLADRVMSALAIPDAQIRVGVLTGAPVPDANASLPALDACVAQS